MKKFKFLAITMLALLTIGGFYACCNDDDDDDNGIVGTWFAYDGDEAITITFNSDETGVISEKWKQDTFTYSMTNKNSGTMTIRYQESYHYHYEVFTFRIEGKSLYLYDDDGDLELVLTKQNSSSTSSSNIVGTWTYKEGNASVSLTFKKDGTGTAVIKYYDSYSGTETNQTTFTYSMTGNRSGTITMREYDSYSGYNYSTYTFKIEGNTLYLYDGSYLVGDFIKQ